MSYRYAVRVKAKCVQANSVSLRVRTTQRISLRQMYVCKRISLCNASVSEVSLKVRTTKRMSLYAMRAFNVWANARTSGDQLLLICQPTRICTCSTCTRTPTPAPTCFFLHAPTPTLGTTRATLTRQIIERQHFTFIPLQIRKLP